MLPATCSEPDIAEPTAYVHREPSGVSALSSAGNKTRSSVITPFITQWVNVADITESLGTTVVCTNHDDMRHTVAADNQPRLFASEALDATDAFFYRYNRIGLLGYFYLLHPPECRAA